jgi:Ca2+-binding RTX toxin-like protein
MAADVGGAAAQLARWTRGLQRTIIEIGMRTRVHGCACRRRPVATRLLLVGAILAAGLGLEEEAQAAVKASVNRGVLRVTGTRAGEKIALRLGARGRLVVDVRDNGSADFTFRRSRFTRIAVNAGRGNDRLRIDERNGPFTNAERTILNGGAGRDVLLGGSFPETLNGGTGNDTADGNGGADTVLLGAGNDRVKWDAGDGSDRIRGDTGADTVTVNGTSGSDAIDVAPTATPAHVGVSGGPDLVGAESLVVNGLAGDDTLSGGALAGLIQLTLNGGAGSDTLNGGNGNDVLNGGTENDTVDGNQGADTAPLGAGTDTFVWDPGDGSDVVEGQADADTLRFNGSAAAEVFAALANGGRLLFTRNVGAISMDADDLETLTLNALGGADTATINDLSATDVGIVNLDLGVAAVGDGAADAVIVNSTTGVDLMSIAGAAGSVTLTRPSLTVAVTNTEPANDTLTVNASAGADLMSASGLASTSVLLTLNGGADGDILVGSLGNDTINGDAGDDLIRGGDGNDTLDGGADTDTIDGGAGIDTATNGETVTNVP